MADNCGIVMRLPTGIFGALLTNSADISALRKAGKLAEAYAMARAWLVSGEDAWRAENALAWVLDAKIKELQAGVKDLTPEVVAKIAELLREYATLKEVKPPNLVHSVVLGRAIKIFEHWSGFLRFTRWWGINNFREEDTVASSTRGERTFESLVVRFSRAFLRGAIAASERGELTLDERAEVKAIADENQRRNPDDEWLPFLYGKFLLAMGELQAAQNYLLMATRRHVREWWAWTKLAESYRHRDPERARVCFSFGLSLPHDESYSRSARIACAEMLAKMGRFDEATQHTRLAKAVSDAQGWHAGSALQHLMESDWFTEREGKTLAALSSCESEAFALVFAEVAPTLGVVDNQNAEKGLAHLSYADGRDGVLYYQNYPQLRGLAIGTVIEAWFEGGDYLPARVAARQDLPEVKGFLALISGKIRRKPEQKFAFLSGAHEAFIGPQLVSDFGIEDGQKRQVFAAFIKKPNGESRAWRALRVI